MAWSVSVRMTLCGVALSAALALTACDEGKPFSRDRIGTAATKLAVPTTMTPPVRVGKIAGAPANWKLRKKVAEALRDRDIPAAVDIKGSTVYQLRGKIVRSTAGGRVRQVNVVWALFTPSGKRVGQATQFASLPDKTNEDVIEAVADSAAESIAPIVPSTRLAYADSVTSGEASPKTRALYEKKNPQTAIGKLGLKKSGIARNLKAHADKKAGHTPDGGSGAAKSVAKTTAGELSTRTTAMSRRLAQGAGTGSAPGVKARSVTTARVATSRSTTALGRIGSGRSALSRNLARGVKKGSPTAKPAPGVTRTTTTSSTGDARSKRLAKLSTSSGDPKPKARIAPRKAAPAVRQVLTEFYLPSRKRRVAPKRRTVAPAKKPVSKKPETKVPATKRPIAVAPQQRAGTARKFPSVAALEE